MDIWEKQGDNLAAENPRAMKQPKETSPVTLRSPLHLLIPSPNKAL